MRGSRLIGFDKTLITGHKEKKGKKQPLSASDDLLLWTLRPHAAAV